MPHEHLASIAKTTDLQNEICDLRARYELLGAQLAASQAGAAYWAGQYRTVLAIDSTEDIEVTPTIQDALHAEVEALRAQVASLRADLHTCRLALAGRQVAPPPADSGKLLLCAALIESQRRLLLVRFSDAEGMDEKSNVLHKILRLLTQDVVYAGLVRTYAGALLMVRKGTPIDAVEAVIECGEAQHAYQPGIKAAQQLLADNF